MADDVCTSGVCDAMGLGMSVLQLGQFIPQHVEMYREKSAVGVSAWLLFFGGLYTWLAALDIVITGGSSAFTCGASPYRCFVANQPLLQMVGSTLLSLSMWYWYLLYQPPRVDVTTDAADDVEGDTYNYGATGDHGGGGVANGGGAPDGAGGAGDGGAGEWSDLDGASCARVLALLLALSTAAAAGVVRFGTPDQATEFAHWCGYVAGFLNAVMWLPQIASTWAYKHKGALSVYWVMFSVLADVIYTTYLIFMGLDVSVWVNNVPDGLQTAVLLGLITYFSWRDRQAGLDDFGHPLHYTAGGDVEHVEAPLLLGKAAHEDGEHGRLDF